MANRIARGCATSGFKGLPSAAALSLVEDAAASLWSIDARAMAGFSTAAELQPMRVLQLWPHKAYLIGHQTELPPALHSHRHQMTDISHGVCLLRLHGDRALPFLNDYTSVDLTVVAGSATRCRLGHFAVTLWWSSHDSVALLIERSYALSFCEYLAALCTRWLATNRVVKSNGVEAVQAAPGN